MAGQGSAPDLMDRLALPLQRQDIIPPAPTLSPTGSTVDWIPEFAGYAWVAYGASSLLVISHLPKPSPLSRDETAIGPIIRQVFELPDHVSAVSWSSEGVVAAASGNGIFLFSPDSSRSHGSFCWSQNAVLRQSSKVEAVKWTESGDGIVAGGIEVVIWKTKSTSWEIAWKSKVDLPQNLVSTSWSIEGPSAAATYPDELVHNGSRCVLVYQIDGRHGYLKAELPHPQPVAAIQWRPSTGRRIKRNLRTRHLLLTCCFDGAVRLWAEIDHGRIKKGKDAKVSQCSFCVVSFIEAWNCLNSSPDASLFVMWATEIRDSINLGGEGSRFFCIEQDEQEQVGQCEWLVGFAPENKITFWAIHCIDDFSPLRYPRVTLWKTEDFHNPEVGYIQTASRKAEEGLLVRKIVVSRNSPSGPPVLCSFLHFSSCSSLFLSMYRNQEDLHKKYLPSASHGIVDVEGHSGKILQVSVHPYYFEGGLAVSIDSNGLLLFWLLSTISGLSCSSPTLIPTWRHLGKMMITKNGPKYTSLSWAPSILDDDRIILLGHVDGIDCLVVRISRGDSLKVECHKLCTIPYSSKLPFDDGPTDIYAIPFPSPCRQTSMDDTFMLLCVWKKGFHVVSWEVTVQSYDSSQSCPGCGYENNQSDNSNSHKFESVFSGRRYCASFYLCSLGFPYPHNQDNVTCSSVICPDGFFPYINQENMTLTDNIRNYYPYVMATGCADGTVKFWRSVQANMHHTVLAWELVGALSAEQGPISQICLADCGQKVAIVCTKSGPNSIETLSIWEPMNLVEAGCFVLEHKISLDRGIVAMKWLSLGNGEQILGVCLHEKLQVYAQRRLGGQSIPNTKSSNMQIWYCIAEAHLSSPIFDFFWGPGATAVVVHHDYISSFGQWKLNRHHYNFHSLCQKKRDFSNEQCSEGSTFSSIYTDPDIFNLDSISIGSSIPFSLGTMLSGKVHNHESRLVDSERAEHNYVMVDEFYSMLAVAEELTESLPVYHPEALKFNLYSGNWRRAGIALRHTMAHISHDHGKRSTTADSDGITIPEIDLSSYLEGPLEVPANKGFHWSRGAVSFDSSFQSQVGSMQSTSEMWSYESSNIFASSASTYKFNGIAESLEGYNNKATAISDKEKREILALANLLSEISNSESNSAYESLDEAGRRFWVAVRYQQLHFFQEFGRVPSVEELVIDSETVCWAFHSDSQESLLSSFLPMESSWKELQVMGVGLWLNNITQLRSRMEKLARFQYLKKKDPKDCTLLYIALNRLQVLAGLFKVSKDEKDKPLMGFLLRNFQEEKNKAAALKNAYVLLGRHQWELAIAFFLLGGDASSAINICIKNLGDEQLALVLCRLVEGCGGPLERHLITKFMFPSAIEKDDYWKASLLEWQLGNYSQSFLCMLGLQSDSKDKPMLLSNHAAFINPTIGLYCRLLTSKNCLRNMVGEHNIAVLSRWAILAMMTALRRCGLHVEALQCFSSSSSIVGSNLGNPVGNRHSEVIPSLLQPSPSNSFNNWLSVDVALQLETYTKFDIAAHHFSRFIRQHPYWPYSNRDSTESNLYLNNNEIHEYGKLREQFLSSWLLDLEFTEQKFHLHHAPFLSRMLLLCYNSGAPSIGYDLLQGFNCHKKSPQTIEAVDSLNLYSCLIKMSAMLSDEVSILFSRLASACGITCFQMASSCALNGERSELGYRRLIERGIAIQDLILSSRNIRVGLEIFSGSRVEYPIMVHSAVTDLLEYCACFAHFWFQRNSEALFLLMQPILLSFSDGHIPYEVDMADAKKVLNHIYGQKPQNNDDKVDIAEHSSLNDESVKHENGGRIGDLIPGDEKCQILAVCLWKHILRFVTHKLKVTSENVVKEHSCSAASFGVDGKNLLEQLKLLTAGTERFLITTLVHVSSYQIKQFTALVHQKMDDGWPVMTLSWLDSIQSPCQSHKEHPTKGDISLSMSNNNDEISIFKKLWDIWADPKIILESLAEEKIKFVDHVIRRPARGWKENHNKIGNAIKAEKLDDSEVRSKSPTVTIGDKVGPVLEGSWQKVSSVSKELRPFQSPREVCRRNGELLEALCINSTDQRQIAVSSHRKGIVFLNWEEGIFNEETYSIWSEADWPQNGWAGSELTPVPTCVSPSIGLGNKRGAHLGLGGATIETGSLGTPGKDFTGGGAFGIPGYAGVGASRLGWEFQEDFEELVERPATLETVRTRAFSNHPSMPYFLVGSSNTHIYLWEFGKDKAIATYGVLPAADVPPPYSLASVSAVQFDHYGHRFCTAALDGTICTWQLEVGGRSNIHPTESSLCFNSHAMDVTYVTSSGSITVAAGYSSNNVNVVLWDTLAPPSSSQASIMCHEGTNALFLKLWY
ncbi:hypothetical protein SAY86_021062 [Trapa natans]|uniref:RAVE complex protein Rav1 C-terminal domain-containing protein n=1 Tax=Trapa natans TaxID=22666 RepID=A0AAN7MRS4_TRANT|nr:hypothetical protein SAY86_021062 [Trapa natans]